MVSNSLRSVWVLGSVAVAAAASGCGAAQHDPNNCTGDACNSTSETQSYCAKDGDCATNEVCTGGICQVKSGEGQSTTCTTHQDCSAGMFCNVVTSRCVQCLNEDQCDPGLVCRADGTCGQNTGCSTNTDCGALKCNTSTHACVQCLVSSDCPSAQSCRSNQCYTSGGTDPVCQSQADCDAYGKVCDTTGHCVACTNTSECNSGSTCTDGACVPDNGDGSCQSSTDCGGQACFLAMCMPCFSDFMCVSLDDLLLGVMKICDINSGNCTDPQCATADDCPTGEGCYSGHCGACADDTECRADETCNTDTGVCGTSGGGTTTVTCPDPNVCTSTDDGDVCLTSTGKAPSGVSPLCATSGSPCDTDKVAFHYTTTAGNPYCRCVDPCSL